MANLYSMFETNNDEKDVITINHPSVTIHVKQDTSIDLKNYISNARVLVQYLGEQI